MISAHTICLAIFLCHAFSFQSCFFSLAFSLSRSLVSMLISFCARNCMLNFLTSFFPKYLFHSVLLGNSFFWVCVYLQFGYDVCINGRDFSTCLMCEVILSQADKNYATHYIVTEEHFKIQRIYCSNVRIVKIGF